MWKNRALERRSAVNQLPSRNKTLFPGVRPSETAKIHGRGSPLREAISKTPHPLINSDGSYPRWFTSQRPEYAVIEWLRSKFQTRAAR